MTDKEHFYWSNIADIDSRRLEITCGEAPYLVTRYDVETGEAIPTGVYYMPDPLEEKIQELCILVITDKIDNLDCLLPIKNKTPQLEFLLAPNDFNYDRVDVSDYMWGNIMRSKKYLPYFIKAKEKIVSKIQRRITIGSASEFERIMLYGFLLDKEELF